MIETTTPLSAVRVERHCSRQGCQGVMRPTNPRMPGRNGVTTLRHGCTQCGDVEDFYGPPYPRTEFRGAA